MIKILDGKKLAKKVLDELKKDIQKLPNKPRLLVLMIGENRASRVFVRKKQEACRILGIIFRLKKISSKFSTARVCRVMAEEIKNFAPDGIVIQLPLPSGINTTKVLACIPRRLDVEGFAGGKIISPVARGIAALLREYGLSVKNKNIAVVGAGRLVGKPVSKLLRDLGGKVKVFDRETKDLAGKIRKADIVISGAGKPNLIQGAMLKPGAVVIDAGASMAAGKIQGDVDFTTVSSRASYLAPVPGGVGPLTVAMLLVNLVELAKK